MSDRTTYLRSRNALGRLFALVIRLADGAAVTHAYIIEAHGVSMATAIPEFKKAGLELISDGVGARGGSVQYRGLRGIEAACAFFELNRGDARDLFIDGEITAKGEARQIKRLVGDSSPVQVNAERKP